MSNKSDWDEIKKDAENYKNDMESKYGIDLQEYGKKYASKNFVKKNNNVKVILRKVFTIFIIIFILIGWIQWRALNTKIEIKKFLTSVYNIDLREEKQGIDILGNGFTIYKINETPEVEVHTMFSTIKKYEYNDLNSRIYKYYFTKWNDQYKNKFIIEENYKDCRYWLFKKKDWILEFKTYIDVNNESEIREATDAIIRFIHFLPYKNIVPESYIRYKNQLILPKPSSGLKTDEEMKNIVEQKYKEIEKE